MGLAVRNCPCVVKEVVGEIYGSVDGGFEMCVSAMKGCRASERGV